MERPDSDIEFLTQIAETGAEEVTWLGHGAAIRLDAYIAHIEADRLALAKEAFEAGWGAFQPTGEAIQKSLSQALNAFLAARGLKDRA